MLPRSVPRLDKIASTVAVVFHWDPASGRKLICSVARSASATTYYFSSVEALPAPTYYHNLNNSDGGAESARVFMKVTTLCDGRA